MTSQFQRQAYNTRRRAKHPLHWAVVALLVNLALCAGAVAADDNVAASGPASGLRPYIAQYKTTTRGMEINLTRKLKPGANGSYTLTNHGKIMVVGFHEVSVFQVAGSRIIPKSYVYQGTGLINRRREVHFTPGTDTIRSLYKEQWYDLPRTDKTLDRMSQQEQLRLLLINDTTPGENLSVQVADGKRVKDYQLIFVGEEVVETGIGPVQALHFERVHDDADRKSDMWLAPAWDYLMVKTTHVEDGNPVEVILNSASIDGIPVQPQ
jgi:hypothetical protein